MLNKEKKKVVSLDPLLLSQIAFGYLTLEFGYHDILRYTKCDLILYLDCLEVLNLEIYLKKILEVSILALWKHFMNITFCEIISSFSNIFPT